MQWMKNMAAHLLAVVKGMLFIGFSVQIVLGLVWMACNFGQVQDFGEPESSLYGGIFALFGKSPELMYLLQLGAAFGAGYFLLGRFGMGTAGQCRYEKAFFLWRALALLTFPFAMQCHLAVLPYSLMGSLYLTALGLLLECYFDRKKGSVPAEREESGSGGEVYRRRRENGISSRKRRGLPGRRFWLTGAAVGCIVLGAALSGEFDRSQTQRPGHSLEGAMASRFAWSYIWQDQDYWSEELKEAAREVLWETSFCPGNMELLQNLLEERFGTEAARAYYLEIARTGWERHAPMVIRQIGWDLLGYTAAPVVFPLQMQGHAYDSCSGRNYEIMRDHAPVLTRRYVDYGCWWFVCCLIAAPAATVCVVRSNVIARKRRGRCRCRDAFAARESRKRDSCLYHRKVRPMIQNPPGVILSLFEKKNNGKALNSERLSGAGEKSESGRAPGGGRPARCLALAGGWALAAGIPAALLTLRGAGMMDYKYTIAINELWLVWALLHMGGKCREGK